MNKLPLAVVKEFVFGEHPPRVHFHIGLQSHTSTEENFLALVKSTSTHYFSQFNFFEHRAEDCIILWLWKILFCLRRMETDNEC